MFTIWRRGVLALGSRNYIMLSSLSSDLWTTGWWLTYPPWKILVSWDYYVRWKNNTCSKPPITNCDLNRPLKAPRKSAPDDLPLIRLQIQHEIQFVLITALCSAKLFKRFGTFTISNYHRSWTPERGLVSSLYISGTVVMSVAGMVFANLLAQICLENGYNVRPPSDVSWFISPSNYSYTYHKP